jgi:hypothetical protein
MVLYWPLHLGLFWHGTRMLTVIVILLAILMIIMLWLLCHRRRHCHFFVWRTTID